MRSPDVTERDAIQKTCYSSRTIDAMRKENKNKVKLAKLSLKREYIYSLYEKSMGRLHATKIVPDKKTVFR